MSTSRWILLAVLTAALGGLLYWLASGAGGGVEALAPAASEALTRTAADAPSALDTGERRGPGGVAVADAAPRPDTEAIADSSARTRIRGAEDDEARETSAPAAEEPAVQAQERPYLLRGLIHGPDQVDGGHTSLRATLRDEPDHEATARATPDGRFEIDVGELLDRAERMRHRTELVVVADHADFLPNETSIGASRQRFTLDRAGEAYEASVGITLERPFTMIHGRALGLGEVRVALMWPPERRRRAPVLVDQRIAPGGKFQLRVPFEGTYTVVAVAEKGQPVWIDVRVEETGAMSLEPLRIPPGRTVEGRIELPPTLDGEGSRLVVEPDWLVQIREAQPREYRRLLDWNNVTWSRDGGYEVREVTAVAGVQGRFRIDGLAARSYRVLLEETDGFPPGNPYLGHLLSPAERDMRLVPHIARLVYRVSGAGGALPGARVSLSSRERSRSARPEYEATTDSKGQVALVVPASLDSTLGVRCEGHALVVLPTKTPLPGREVHMTVHLEELPASLAVRFDPPAGARVPESVRLEVTFEGEPVLIRILPVRVGTALLGGLPAGKAEVRVRTTDEPPADLDHFEAIFRPGHVTSRDMDGT